MRAFIAAAVAATMFAGSAFASDPFNGNGWQRARPPAAVAYFKFSFQDSKTDRTSYGFAVTAPTPRRYGTAPLLIADSPKLLDLRFKGAVPDTLRLSEQVAWSMSPSTRSDGRQHDLLGVPGLGGLILGVALTAAAAYGIYTLVKEECPAISTTTGGCVEPAN
jgi:hypothetical protein